MSKHDASQKTNDFTLPAEQLGDFTPSALAGLFQPAAGADRPAVIVAAAAFAASHDPYSNFVSEAAMLAALDYLARCSHSGATAYLRQMANAAQSRWLRLQAVKRLGPKAADEASRELLRKYAQEGCAGGVEDTRLPTNSEQIQLAALVALATVPEPSDKDFQAVLAVADATEGAEDDGLFEAAAGALRRMKPDKHLPQVIQALSKCRSRVRKLWLLAACADVPADLLATNREELGGFLADALNEFGPKHSLPDLKTLARNITTAKLLKALSEQFGSNDLTSGPRSILAEVLQAYQIVDETLLRACLCCARGPHLPADGLCVDRLAECVAGGYAHAILRQFADQAGQSWDDKWLSAAVLRRLFGTISDGVAEISRFLDGLEESHRNWLEPKLVLCVLRLTDQDRPATSVVKYFGGFVHSGWQSRDMPRPEAQAVEDFVSDDGNEHEGLHALAVQLAQPRLASGAISMAQQLLANQGPIGDALARWVLAECHDLPLNGPGDLPENWSVLRLEDAMVTHHAAALRQAVASLAVRDGRINRYVVDLARRKSLKFNEIVGTILKQHLSAQDGVFLVSCLRASGTMASLQQAAGLLEGYLADGPDGGVVRIKAIEVLGEGLQREGSQRSTESAKLLTAIHRAFTDVPDIRASAYRACQQVGAMESIAPLKEREPHEQESACREALAAALKTLAGRLRERKPRLADKAGVLSWLRQVAILQDPTFLQEIAAYQRHPDLEVQSAFVVCIGQLGQPEGVALLEEFSRQMSPGPDIKAQVRQAILHLRDREDASLFELLEQLLAQEAKVLDLEIDYQRLLGLRHLNAITNGLRLAVREWNAGHWGPFITSIDGVCDILVKVLYEKYLPILGIASDRAAKLLKDKYHNRLKVAEFEQRMGRVQRALLDIHDLRGEDSTAHAQGPDGSNNTPAEEQEAKQALDRFGFALPEIVEAFRRFAGTTATA